MQHDTGEYKPMRTPSAAGKPAVDIPWSDELLAQHLAGEKSLGHYMIGAGDKTKLIAFDIDLEKNSKPGAPHPFQGVWVDESGVEHEFDARESWKDRAHPAREQLKTALMWTAVTIAATAERELGLRVAAAYSGNKGVHVYCWPNHFKPMSAEMAYDGAALIMDEIGEFVASRGHNFFRHQDQTPGNILRNVTIETFPKQPKVGNESGYGNLMRLPLGRNLKNPRDGAFFLDLKAPFHTMSKIDPVVAMSDFPTWR